MNEFEAVTTSDYGYYQTGEELTETYTPIEIYSDITGETLESEYIEMTTMTEDLTTAEDIKVIKDGVLSISAVLIVFLIALTGYMFYKILGWFF